MTDIAHRRAVLWAHRVPLVLLVMLPVLANAVALSGFFNTDPTLHFIAMGMDLRAGLFHGAMGWYDPTVAYITQPLGHLVVSDWLHGTIPWWNPYSGVGMPLAAEMQTSPFFFPFVLLLHWDCGWLLLRVLLQTLCGLFAYMFFIETGLRRTAGFFGATLYALSPLFFLDPHAAIAPLPFLPLLLLGIEYAARATSGGKPMGWSLITVAVAYSIFGGFPEVAYFDGLLAGLWSLWRCSTLPPRLWHRFALKLSAGLAVALGLCAPLLIPFLEYLPLANIGAHGGASFLHIRLDAALVPLQAFPFLYGPLISLPPAAIAQDFGLGWIRIPGWAGLPVLLLALAAVWRRGATPQPRYVLLAWIALWEASYVGFPPAIRLLAAVPGLDAADATRFSGPMVDFAIYMLAAYGFDDYLTLGALSRARLGGVLGSILIIAVAAVAPVGGFIVSWWTQKPLSLMVCFAALQAVLAVLVLLCAELRQPRRQKMLVAALLAGPVCGFAYSQFAGLRGGHIDTAPIQFLAANAGTSRMLSLGPLDLNFPARYGIASVNYAAMPAPQSFSNYITANLFADEDRNIYKSGAPGQRAFVLGHLPAYAALGVRYIVTGQDDSLATNNYTLLPVGARNLPYALQSGGSFSGIVTPRLPFASITAVSVAVGTYGGGASGPLTVTLCAASQCQSGTADAGTAADNSLLTFPFAVPLAVPTGAALRFSFSHPSGARVAVWLAPDASGAEQPTFSFIGPPATNSNGLSLVFRSATTAIYELAGVAPYASADSCQVTILNRTAMHAACPSPSRLIRREMYFPGWSATVNGAAAPVAAAPGGLFQTIALPAGQADIRFSYAPPHIGLACALALLALVLWLGLAAASYQRR